MMWLLACAPPTELVSVADEGDLGPFGVASTTFTAARKTGRWFDVDVHLPTEGDAPTSDNPVVILVQGGAVERDRYHWLAEEIAADGNVVLSPQYPSDLAIFGSNRSFIALKRARTLDQAGDPVLAGTLGDRVTVMGHSLGGVVSAKQWVRHDELEHLVILASYPANGDAVEDIDTPVLSITGSEDGSAALSDVRVGAERFPDATLAVVDGMTHYDWTDEVTADEVEKEGTEATRPQGETRAAALLVIEAYLRGESLDREFPGVTLE